MEIDFNLKRWRNGKSKLLRSLLRNLNRVLTSACLFVADWLGRIAVESFTAVMTMSSGCIMSTINTNSARNTTRELVQFQIKTTASGVSVAIAGWKRKREEEINNVFDLKCNSKYVSWANWNVFLLLSRDDCVGNAKRYIVHKSHQFSVRQHFFFIQECSTSKSCCVRAT